MTEFLILDSEILIKMCYNGKAFLKIIAMDEKRKYRMGRQFWMKITHNWFVKCICAGIVALGILSLFSVFYYNPPIHVPCESGATDYTRQAEVFWARGTEGIASGTTDESGYNNSFAKTEAKISVLLMGSSQTEGLYVDEDKNVGYRLNEMFAENGETRYVYNIGMSSHNFLRNVSNLETALSVYQPAEYVVLETDYVDFTTEDVDLALQDQMVPLASYEDGFLYQVQKIPYAKLLYQQYKNYKENDIETTDIVKTEQANAAFNTPKVEELLMYIKEKADAHGVMPIIFYVPHLALGEDGTLTTSANAEKVACFSDLCSQNGIVFLDMTEDFVEEYTVNHRIVSGFSNTAECYGHLNRYGHELIAEKIYREIERGQ